MNLCEFSNKKTDDELKREESNADEPDRVKI